MCERFVLVLLVGNEGNREDEKGDKDEMQVECLVFGASCENEDSRFVGL